MSFVSSGPLNPVVISADYYAMPNQSVLMTGPNSVYLPPLPPNGTEITLVALSDPATLRTQGGETITAGSQSGLASLPVGAGADCTLKYMRGNTTWYRVGTSLTAASGALKPVVVTGSSYSMNPNELVLFTSSGGGTLYLPDHPADGTVVGVFAFTGNVSNDINGNGNQISDGINAPSTLVSIAANASVTLVYSATLARWQVWQHIAPWTGITVTAATTLTVPNAIVIVPSSVAATFQITLPVGYDGDAVTVINESLVPITVAKPQFQSNIDVWGASISPYSLAAKTTATFQRYGTQYRLTHQTAQPPGAWVALPYSATWANYGTAGFTAAGYVLEQASGFVSLRGLACKTSGAKWVANEAIATLPPGFRPTATESFVTHGADGAGTTTFRVDVSAAGAIQLVQKLPTAGPPSGLVTFLSLTPIRFRIS